MLTSNPTTGAAAVIDLEAPKSESTCSACSVSTNQVQGTVGFTHNDATRRGARNRRRPVDQVLDALDDTDAVLLKADNTINNAVKVALSIIGFVAIFRQLRG